MRPARGPDAELPVPGKILSALMRPFLKKLINLLFIFGCVGSLLLRAAFSSCKEQGLLFVAVRGLLIAVASPVAEHGL